MYILAWFYVDDKIILLYFFNWNIKKKYNIIFSIIYLYYKNILNNSTYFSFNSYNYIITTYWHKKYNIKFI